MVPHPPPYTPNPPTSTHGNWRFKKLDLPLFDGVNPDGWILRAERYFRFYRLEETEKVEAAVVALEGDALLWFQWENGRSFRWEELKGLLLRQFRPAAAGSLHEQWLAHEQEGSVVEYRRRFIELLAPLEGIPEEVAKCQFINKLNGDIRAEVRLLNPSTLDMAMDMAVKAEDKLKWAGPRKINLTQNRPQNSLATHSAYLQPTPTSYRTHTQSYNKPNNQTYQPSQNGSNNFSNRSTATSHNFPARNFPITNPMRGSGEVRRLSEKEMQQKREKGLCFRCDEKWNVGHRCRRRELSVLVCAEEEGDEVEALLGDTEVEEVREDATIENQPEISLNSVGNQYTEDNENAGTD